MVELKEKELVIRIETEHPEEELKDLLDAVIYFAESMDNDFMNHNSMYPMFAFLSALLPSTDQLKKLKE